MNMKPTSLPLTADVVTTSLPEDAVRPSRGYGNNNGSVRSEVHAAGNNIAPEWPVHRVAEKPKELFLDVSLYGPTNSLGLRCVPLRARDHIGLLGSGKIACAIGKARIFGFQLRAQPSINVTTLLAPSTTTGRNFSTTSVAESNQNCSAPNRLWHKFHSYSHESLLCVSACETPREKPTCITPADVQVFFAVDSEPEGPSVTEKNSTDYADTKDFILRLIEKDADICAILFVLPLCMPSDVPVSLGITLEYAMRDANFPLSWASGHIGCVPNKVPRAGRDFVQITSRLCLLNMNANSFLRRNIPFLDNDEPLWHAVKLAVDEAVNVARSTEIAEVAVRSPTGPRLLVMGGKDAGKSTIVRYCLNSWLPTFCSEKVRIPSNDPEFGVDDALERHTPTSSANYLLPQVLDVDIGQSEFQVAGHVVLCDVEQPVWGSPGCRLTKPRAQVYLGVASPTNPYPLTGEYCNSIERLANQHCDRSRPLVVNTMGWVQGQGHAFIEHVVDVVKPHVIIDLGDYSEELRQHVYTAGQIKSRPDFTRIHRMHRSYSDRMPRPWCRMPNAFRRELALMARLCEVFDNRPSRTGRMTTVASPNLLMMPPMKLPLSKFAFHCVGGEVLPSLLLRALNVSVVAICQLSQADFVAQTRTLDEERDAVKFDERNPLWLEKLPINAVYFGLGIIVGVDGPERQMFMLTAVPQQVVECDANVIVRGAVDLPKPIADNFEQYRNFGRPPPSRPAAVRSDLRSSPSQEPRIQRQQPSPTERNQTNREIRESPERRKQPGSEIPTAVFVRNSDNRMDSRNSSELSAVTDRDSPEVVRPYFVPRSVQLQRRLVDSSSPQPSRPMPSNRVGFARPDC